jgi:MtN3 and saliva related transmembrane protein
MCQAIFQMIQKLFLLLMSVSMAHATNTTNTDSKAAIGLGITAGMLGGGFNLPQLVRIYRTKRVKDISVSSQISVWVIAVLWIAYGALKDDWILIASSAASAVIQIPILIGLWCYRKQDPFDGFDYTPT